MKALKLTLGILALLLPAVKAGAAPLISQPHYLDSTIYGKRVIFPDHQHQDLFYLFPTAIAVEEKNQRPLLGWHYTQVGLQIYGTVKVGRDLTVLQHYQQILRQQHPGSRLQYPPVLSGKYSLTLQDSAQSPTIGSHEGYFGEDDSGNPWFFHQHLGKNLSDLIVASFSTAASFGVNYSYQYVAATDTEIILIRLGPGGQERLAELDTASLYSEEQLLAIINQAQNHLDVYSESSDSSLSSLLTLGKMALFSILKDNCFYQQSGFSGRPQYRYRPQSCSQTLSQQIRYKFQPRFIAKATVGITFGGLCHVHPGNFSFSGVDDSIISGCPDRPLPPYGFPITEFNVPQPLRNGL